MCIVTSDGRGAIPPPLAAIARAPPESQPTRAEPDRRAHPVQANQKKFDDSCLG
jgi:hypothetical protein